MLDSKDRLSDRNKTGNFKLASTPRTGPQTEKPGEIFDTDTVHGP